MPDSAGSFKGTGWSRKGEEAWTRIFGGDHEPNDSALWAYEHGGGGDPSDLSDVPHGPPHEDLDERADRDEAAGWGR